TYGALRAGWSDHTLTLEVRRRHSFQGRPPVSGATLAYEYSKSILQGSLLGEDGALLSASSSYSRKDKSILGQPRDLFLAGGKLEIPIKEGMKLPVTVKWANHEDLLEGVSKVTANIGISVDFGGLKKGAK
ncbi:MAG TPA: hypothetical protein VKF32_15540, partial [Thermoanaerobaculia bacterium]|nr:hypothetical protein [Thermoanaerobaculia bacterium]